MKEAARYVELKMFEKVGKISHLQLQPKFELQPKFTDTSGKKHRALAYIPDFIYVNMENGEMVVEDVKGILTDVYKIKLKLFLSKYKDLKFYEI